MLKVASFKPRFPSPSSNPQMISTEVLTPSQPQQSLKKKAQMIETTHAQSQQPSAIIMETLQSIRHQMTGQTQDIQQRASGQIEYFRHWITRSIQGFVSTLREYAYRFPPFAAFLFSLLVLSAIPVSLYMLFVVCTGVVGLAIALIGFLIIEGAVLVCGSGVLLFILGIITSLTVALFTFVSFLYVGYRAAVLLFERASQMTSAFNHDDMTVTHPVSHQLHNRDNDSSTQKQ